MSGRKELTLEELNLIIGNFDDKRKKVCREEETQITFIKNLIEQRKKKGLSQQELANITGLSQQVISAFEQCDRKPTLPNLIKYLLGLGIDINKLFS
nr:helix-turn-helix transcriptional regulator [Clostridium chromiireducens]